MFLHQCHWDKFLYVYCLNIYRLCSCIINCLATASSPIMVHRAISGEQIIAIQSQTLCIHRQIWADHSHSWDMKYDKLHYGWHRASDVVWKHIIGHMCHFCVHFRSLQTSNMAPHSWSIKADLQDTCDYRLTAGQKFNSIKVKNCVPVAQDHPQTSVCVVPMENCWQCIVQRL